MFGSDSLKVLLRKLNLNFLQTAHTYQSLALAHNDIHDYKKAIEFQEKCLAILKKVKNIALSKKNQQTAPEEQRIKDSEIFLEKMRRSLNDHVPPYTAPKKITKKTKDTAEDEEKEKGGKESDEFEDLENAIKIKVWDCRKRINFLGKRKIDSETENRKNECKIWIQKTRNL